MPRPKRVRIIQEMPKCLKFESQSNKNEITKLSFEEYEAIRLMDYQHLTHDEAATMMNVSRTTVTEIYEQARNKIAEALCEGNSLHICGGNYEFASKESKISNFSFKEEGKNMKIAVTYENGNVYGHFGHTENFKIYEVEDGKILKSEVIPTNGQGHGKLATLLGSLKVDLLICGGIGGGAISALSAFNIGVLPGVSGDCDAAVNGFLTDTLVTDPNAHCTHHDGEDHECCGEHHGEGHECGCGEHHHDHECGCHNK